MFQICRFFKLWNTNQGIGQNVQSALFNTMKVDRGKKKNKNAHWKSLKSNPYAFCTVFQILWSHTIALWEDETVVIHKKSSLIDVATIRFHYTAKNPDILLDSAKWSQILG